MEERIINNVPVKIDSIEINNDGASIAFLKSGTYIFECFNMPWTEYELRSDRKFNDNNPIEVAVQLSTSDIQDIIDMMKWAWDNHWMERSISETVCSKLLQTRLPHLYDQVQRMAHKIFCEQYPNSEHINEFGVYEIFCPDEIVDFASSLVN